MKYALFDTVSSLVLQWQDHDQLAFAPATPEQQLLALADDFQFPEAPHWVVGGQLTALEPAALAPSLASVKAAVWERIKAMRDRLAEASGFECAGKWFHSDLHSKTQHLGNKDTARDQLAAGGVMADALVDPAGGGQIVWKTMDGTFQPLTCQLAFDIVKAGKGAEFAHFHAAEQHRTAMEASADPGAYDFSAGWPAAFVA